MSTIPCGFTSEAGRPFLQADGEGKGEGRGGEGRGWGMEIVIDLFSTIFSHRSAAYILSWFC